MHYLSAEQAGQRITLKLEVSAMKQRKWTADEKLAIVMEGHKENSPVEVFEKCKKPF